MRRAPLSSVLDLGRGRWDTVDEASGRSTRQGVSGGASGGSLLWATLAAREAAGCEVPCALLLCGGISLACYFSRRRSKKMQNEM
jgi:hypothetical protein